MHFDINHLPNDTRKMQNIVRSLIDSTAKLEAEKNSLQLEKSELQNAWKLEKVRLEDIINQLKLQLAILKAQHFGSSCEKNKKQIEDLETRIEDHELTLGINSSSEQETSSKEKSESIKPTRQKLPEHLPREEIILDTDSNCKSCNSTNLRKFSEDVCERLEYKPASFIVQKYIRPRVICKDCQEIMQADPVSAGIDKGKAGPGLLAHVLVQKYSYHLPLYRQSLMYKSEGIDLSRSTMAGWVYSCSQLLAPLVEEIQKHVFASDHIHGDDTSVRVLAPSLGKTKTGRLWTYVVDGRPHGSDVAPAACYFYSDNRGGINPLSHLKDYKGVFHADAYAGYNKLYADSEGIKTDIVEAGCWAHMRRKFYEVTIGSKNAVIAQEVIDQVSKIYKIENDVRGLDPGKILSVRAEYSKKLVDELFESFKKVGSDLPQKGATKKAINYALNNESALRYFLQDGKAQIDNNIAERAVRGIAVGRKNWLFAGSDRGGASAANIYTILETAKLNGIDPWKYLNKVLLVIQDYNSKKLAELLPWNIILENNLK